jgi:hypothetical protein
MQRSKLGVLRAVELNLLGTERGDAGLLRRYVKELLGGASSLSRANASSVSKRMGLVRNGPHFHQVKYLPRELGGRPFTQPRS